MKLRVGAKGLVSRSDGKVLLVREADVTYVEGTEAGKWDVVGGRIESDECLLNGLYREIKEESGLVVEARDVVGVAETFPIINDEQHHIIRIYYVCVTKGDDVTLSSDHDKHEWIDPENYTDYNIMEDLHDIFANYLKLV